MTFNLWSTAEIRARSWLVTRWITNTSIVWLILLAKPNPPHLRAKTGSVKLSRGVGLAQRREESFQSRKIHCFIRPIFGLHGKQKPLLWILAGFVPCAL